MNEDHLTTFIATLKTKAPITKSTGKRKRTKQEKRQLRAPPMAELQVDTEDNVQRLTVSYHHQNGHINLNSSINLQTNSMNNDNSTFTATNLKQQNSPSLSICNMCSRSGDVCINVQNNHGIVLTVSDMTRLPSWNIREILASVCSRCLVYISTLTESSSKLRMRCEQAIHHQTAVLAPPTPDTSPNNFLQTPISLLEETGGADSNNLQQRNRYAPGYCEDADINDLALLPKASSLPLEINQTFATSRSSSPNNPGHNSMLEIHHERPVSPLNTESGGGGRNNKRSYQRVSVIPMQMICAHCNRAYWRKDYYNKHMRRCGARNRYTKSLAGTRPRSASRLEFLDAVSVISEGEDLITTVHRPRVFHCNQCAVTVDTIRKLREHKQIHLQRFYCDICSKEFTSVNEFEFHRAECTAKLEVFEIGLANIRNDVSSPDFMPARRKTRSYSRAASVAPSLAPSRAASSKSTKKPPEKKTKKPPAKKEKRNTQQQQIKEIKTQPDDVQSTITNFVKRNAELYTNDLDETQNVEEADDDVIDNEDDDAISEVDTMYSKRLSLTYHWVEEHSHSSHSQISQRDNYMEENIKDIPFKLFKEYDLYLLDRLKVEVKQSALTCFVPECKFTANTLTDIMVHDYLHHFKRSWFYCNKCGHCFTSKVFLDYHLELQNKGRYVCYKCGGHFEYQHQLDRHFLQHAKHEDEMMDKYICHYCNYEFLDKGKLLKHCDEENHNFNTERPCITIDHSMTIVNEVPFRKVRRSKKYKVRILNMVLKRMPSKRCTPMERYRPHLPPHLQNPYIQNRIGRVEFRYPLNPNCVGCL